MEYRRIIDVDIREFDRRTFEKTWDWLSDPEIKELTATPDLDREAREIWFRGLKDRKDYYIRSVWRDDDPIAVFGIKHITDSDGEAWGYIGEKKYWGKAIGIEMFQHLIDYAVSLNLQSLYIIFIKSNHFTYKIGKRFGFEVDENNSDSDTITMRRHL
ncbi:Protein N-acetyltransferase, RimJ/RimL family [Porphyromonadaceae bacterium KH3CP3RA]|nr:Protein N-acetyltransferase, RimJ/RimL family [Porphyromonadaceae bacterium KH3CP3RA]